MQESNKSLQLNFKYLTLLQFMGLIAVAGLAATLTFQYFIPLRWHSWIARPPPKGQVPGSNPGRGASKNGYSAFSDYPMYKKVCCKCATRRVPPISDIAAQLQHHDPCATYLVPSGL